jgi:hypothetical protein
MKLSSLQRKELADKFLSWLKDKNISRCDRTYDVIKQCSKEIDEPIYDIWKAYDLLKIMGRITLNRADGKAGFTVLDFTPLSVVVVILKTETFKNQIEQEMLIKILKSMKRRFSYIWGESLEKV